MLPQRDHPSPVSPTATATGSTQTNMVRNIDFPEAIIFYDSEADDDGDNDGDQYRISVLLEDDGVTPREGLLELLQECKEVQTPVLLIQPSNPEWSYSNHKDILSYLHQVLPEQSPRAPNPKTLYEAIASLTIQPAGFGGSSGFGRKLADPERPPLSQRVVVFCTSNNVCRAARYMGMRVMCFQDNDLADAILDDYYQLYLEDIATPGSYWLNPPYPRDDEGNKVDVYDIMYKDDDNNEDSEASMSEKDRLRMILDDMDPL